MYPICLSSHLGGHFHELYFGMETEPLICFPAFLKCSMVFLLLLRLCKKSGALSHCVQSGKIHLYSGKPDDFNDSGIFDFWKNVEIYLSIK